MLACLPIAFLTVLFACPAVSRADVEEGPSAPESRITRVVTYPEHAEITRVIQVEVVAGDNLVRFGSLVPIFNSNTLRASASTGARITGTEIRTVFLQESISEELNDLDQRIRALSDAVAVEGKAMARHLEEAAFYRAVKSRLAQDMGRDLEQTRVAVADWEEVLTFVSEGLGGTDAAMTASELKVRDLENEVHARTKEREAYAERQPKEMKEVDVAFVSDSPGAREVRIHYVVPAAAWVPSYDVHLDTARAEIEVIGYGEILQWAGESWDDVELSLAMSRPDAELAIPELTPLVVSLSGEELASLVKEVQFLGSAGQGHAQTWKKSRFTGRQERETFRRNLELLSQQSSESLAQVGLSHLMVQGAMTRISDRFAAVRYDIGTRETIPYDGSPHKVVAFSARVPAKLKYVATPALGNSVMLQAEVVNTTGQPLLEGAVALFVDDAYVGSSKGGNAAQNESVSFGFGPDDALVVDRRLLSRTRKGPEAFRQSQVITFTYEITIQNYNDHAAEVEVADQIPISKTDDIQVSFLGSSHEAELDDSSGTLNWSLSVDPSSKITVTYAFSVECPVNRTVHWK